MILNNYPIKTFIHENIFQIEKYFLFLFGHLGVSALKWKNKLQIQNQNQLKKISGITFFEQKNVNDKSIIDQQLVWSDKIDKER